jgi:hypothetical protein
MHWGLRRSPKSLVLSDLRVCYSVRYKKIILLRSYYKRLSCDFFYFYLILGLTFAEIVVYYLQL